MCVDWNPISTILIFVSVISWHPHSFALSVAVWASLTQISIWHWPPYMDANAKDPQEWCAMSVLFLEKMRISPMVLLFVWASVDLSILLCIVFIDTFPFRIDIWHIFVLNISIQWIESPRTLWAGITCPSDSLVASIAWNTWIPPNFEVIILSMILVGFLSRICNMNGFSNCGWLKCHDRFPTQKYKRWGFSQSGQLSLFEPTVPSWPVD